MSKLICSKLFTDVNIRIPYKVILNCCYRWSDDVLNQELLDKYGTNVFNQRQESINDRLEMLDKNQLPNLCRACKNTWPNSHYQYANLWNDYDWTNEDVDQLKRTKTPARFIDLMLGTTCNMSCTYCNESSSNTWAKIKGVPELNPDANFKKNVLDKFYEWVEQNIQSGDPTEQEIMYNFVGGEPFLEPEIFDVMENILYIHKTNKKSKYYPRFFITTNLNVKSKIIENYLSMVENTDAKFAIVASLDAVGEQGETIRTGLDFNLWDNNWKKLLPYDQQKLWLAVAPTMSILNVPIFDKFLEYIIPTSFSIRPAMLEGQRGWNISYGIVSFPSTMAPGLLPQSYAKMIDHTLKIYENLWPRHEGMQYLYNIKSNLGKLRNPTLLEEARSFFHTQGKLKNLDYFNIFPFLSEVLDA